MYVSEMTGSAIIREEFVRALETRDERVTQPDM